MDYMKELRKVQNTLKNVRNEIMHAKKLAKKIDKESDIGVPAIFISSKKNNSNWTAITLSVIVMIGLYFCKMACIQKFYSIRYNTYF
ncbi:hypothetical protein HN011_004873 [Eciton burchellii]|nr:hypothetical protein HN011_004873 [Eciton burchellii]